MRKEALLFSWLATALVVVAVVVLAGLPGPAEAGQRYPITVASAIGGDGAVAAQADLLDCAASPRQHQFHCHRVTPAAQATATTQPSGEEVPVLTSGYAGAIPRALHARVAVVATVTSSWRVPRFLLGSFRS